MLHLKTQYICKTKADTGLVQRLDCRFGQTRENRDHTLKHDKNKHIPLLNIIHWVICYNITDIILLLYKAEEFVCFQQANLRYHWSDLNNIFFCIW